MKWRLKHVLFSEAGDGSTGGGASAGDNGGAGAASDGGSAGAGVASSNGAGGGAAASSVLAAGAGAGASNAGAGATHDPNAWAPEKHRVFGEDGKTLDVEATARKVAEAYQHAEKRIGSGDLPPKSADDYKINVPEALADKVKADDLAKSDDFKGMLSKAHAEGFSQKQVDFMVGEFLDRSMKLQQGMTQLHADECTAKLQEVWTSKADFDKNVQQAYKAASTYGNVDSILSKYGNDPEVIQLLAKVGAELGEDAGAPNEAAGMTEPDVEALQKSEAYWKPSHPDHAKTKAKVDAYYSAKFSNDKKASGPVVFSS